MVGSSMNDELERIRKEAILTQTRYYTGIFLEALRIPTGNLGQDSRCPVRDSK
jgi:hypothetical protein